MTKIATDNKNLLELIKRAKKRETLILNKRGILQKRDFLEISEGNLIVLETIPLMMKSEEYRNQLRRLTFDFKMRMLKPFENRRNWTHKR